ncbi:MAG: hypothetical protein HOV68_33640 [Streptomycetaceae bacterium]|nr:hypothetical protein [Streptomycetaceae bacterium]
MPVATRRVLTWETIRPRTRIEFRPEGADPVVALVDDTGPSGDGFTIRTKPYVTWVWRADADAGRVASAPSPKHTAAFARTAPDDPAQPGDAYVAWCKRCDWEAPPSRTRAEAEYAFATKHPQDNGTGSDTETKESA